MVTFKMCINFRNNSKNLAQFKKKLYLCTVKLREGGLHFSKEHILCIRFLKTLRE